MHFVEKNPAEKKSEFAKKLRSGKLLRFPGAYNPLVAKLIEQIGYDGIYVSGGVMANDLGFPDIGLTTLNDVANRSHQIARVTNLPTIIDIDTGFGEPMNVSRTIQTIETLGVSGCHIEDQTNPKRCGHLDNKELVSTQDMVKKIKAATDARVDKNFLIIARTDANAVEGLDKTIARCKAYVDAGADMIFPEAMKDESEFEKMRKELSSYLLANMTEFGKSKLLTKEELENLGYNLVIYPVTTQRLAMKNVEDGLRQIFEEGHQNNVINKMQTRKRLYEIVDYEKYGEFDQSIFNFSQKGHD
jgi:methylisocitrate lyase